MFIQYRIHETQLTVEHLLRPVRKGLPLCSLFANNIDLFIVLASRDQVRSTRIRRAYTRQQ